MNILTQAQSGRELWDFRTGQARMYWSKLYPLEEGKFLSKDMPAWRFMRVVHTVTSENAYGYDKPKIITKST